MPAPARPTILVVEDERIVARDLQRSLTHLGYQVPATAASGAEAIQLATDRCPDLVLMDIRIKGGLDGIQTAELLRTRFDIPVVYLTASADEDTVARARTTGPYGYLLKPLKPEELHIAVELALHKHQLERRLRAREHWFSTTLSAISDAVIATDRAGDVTFMNLTAELLTGVRREEAVGRPVTEIFKVVDERTHQAVGSPIARALTEGRIAGLPRNSALRTPLGDRPINDSTAPIIDDSGTLLGAVLVFRDVTEQRRLEQQAAMADRLSSLGTLTAGVAHEINNPLAVVVATADHLARKLGAMRASGQDGLEELVSAAHDLQESAERIRQIVADLRAFSRPQEEAEASIDLHSTIDWAIRITETEVRLRARVVRDFGPTPKVRASEVRLGQIFVSLIINASQAIEEGHADRNEIRIAAGADGAGRAVVTVQDTGCGMTPDVLKRVFEPFFTTRGVGQGTGLGLAVCHGVVTSLGGEITVDSAVGKGSTFRVVLPPAADVARDADPGVAALPAALRGKVLMIDDEPMLLNAVRRTLGRDHDLTTCLSSSQALELMKQHPDYDVVLCDLMMPGLAGMDLYEKVLAFSPALARRMVFSSGGAFTPRAVDFLATVGNAQLEKPFSPAIHGWNSAFDQAPVTLAVAADGSRVLYGNSEPRMHEGGALRQAYCNGIPATWTTGDPIAPITRGMELTWSAGIAFHPTIPTRALATYDDTGVFELDLVTGTASILYERSNMSTPGFAGRNNQFPTSDMLTSPVYDPADPSVAYVGGGRIYGSAAAGGGAVYKTTTGGISWSRLGTAGPLPDPASVGNSFVTLLAGGTVASRALWATFFRGGVFRSADSGATWSQATSVPAAAAAGAWRVLADPNASTTIYLGVRDGPTGAGKGLFKSINAGASWTDLGLGCSFSDLILFPGRPLRILASCIPDVADVGGGVWLSTVGGGTSNWARVLAEPSVGALAQDPADPDRLYAAVIAPFGITPSAVGIHMSLDGGNTWFPVSTEPDRFHTRVLHLKVNPNNRKQLFIGTQGRGLVRATF